MTIDERLERLTERHEALAESLQLLTADVHQLTGNVSRLEALIRQDGEHIRTLARIAELHHERLERLEGGE